VTIKNKTKSLKIPFTFIQTNNTGQFKASFQINRLDFCIGESSALLGDIVTIFVTLNTMLYEKQRHFFRDYQTVRGFVIRMDESQYTQPLTVFNGGSLGQHVRHTIEFFQCL
jgi:hypothetical protein